jgi:hypothetical protein
MLRSYLEGRKLLVDRSLQQSRITTCGVPQGSVLGPALWNVFYDYLLKIDTPPGVQLVAFDDDVAVIGISRTDERAVALLNSVLRAISHWIERHIRYSGVELDSRLSFTKHIAAESTKANESARAIGWLMLIITGQTCAAGVSSK